MTKNRVVFCLTAVKALDGSRLALSYADGAEFVVDLTVWLNATVALQRLREPALFSTAKLGAWGRTVEFGVSGEFDSAEIDLSGDNLRNLAVEQSGGIGHERIWSWMHDNDLTLEKAAEVLGMSRRMLIYYRNGEKPIPRHIWLACVGWETLRAHGEAA